jgi:hypothetical protein
MSELLSHAEIIELLPFMREDEARLLDRLLSQESAWIPQPGPQLEAYLNPADELFFGGAAGGGKSDLILGLAAQEHHHSVIFRREYPQLQGLQDRSREIMGPMGGTFNQNANRWRLPGGRKVDFGAVQYAKDKEKWQGRPHDAKLFDEITHFPRDLYIFLNGWRRTAVEGQRTRTVVTGNPPTSADGEWVIQHWGPWLDPDHPLFPYPAGELVWYAMLPDEKGNLVERIVPSGERIWSESEQEFVEPSSRTFIPSKVEDNSYLMATGYKRRLQMMPEPLRSKLLKGDFFVVADDPWNQVIPTKWIKLAHERWDAGPPRDDQGRLRMAKAVGVDVSRGGSDRTCVATLIDNWLAPLETYVGEETDSGYKTAGIVLAKQYPAKTRIGVDVIGVGSSTYDILSNQRTNVVAFNASEGTDATDRTGTLTFVNKRAEAYWRIREALDPDGDILLALPPDRELEVELKAPRFEMRARGIQIESKDDISERLGRSPDKADAVVIANQMLYEPQQSWNMWAA